MVEAILSAALERVERGGEDDVPLQEIANRAGVGIGSLYDYFRDRRSVLAALAAKMTEDNLRAFEALLIETEPLPLPESIERIVDFAFATYATNKQVPRGILKIAHSLGLMPTLAKSQSVFTESLATSLRRRKDITHPNIELAAWTVTQATMGVVHALIWEDQPTHEREALRADLVTLCSKHLLA
ncbi:Transcriptional regulator, TetR family [Labilithrix luteola]|uniref:Transcriptional regulator, TetR family n=1 Tax=Labilithrix luteola TaxID=1391654 RepID=A0A0K1PN46_9BACT|nr:Transcriptional regulator, TetR family [Labilithrix luteola]